MWPSSTPDTFGRVNQQKLFKIEENTTEQLTVQPAPNVPPTETLTGYPVNSKETHKLIIIIALTILYIHPNSGFFII